MIPWFGADPGCVPGRPSSRKSGTQKIRDVPGYQLDAAKRVASLTPRQRQIMDLVLAGHPSKNIGADLGISQRTVEHHRTTIMKKTGANSLPALARLALAAAEDRATDPGQPSKAKRD